MTRLRLTAPEVSPGTSRTRARAARGGRRSRSGTRRPRPARPSSPRRPTRPQAAAHLAARRSRHRESRSRTGRDARRGCRLRRDPATTALPGRGPRPSVSAWTASPRRLLEVIGISWSRWRCSVPRCTRASRPRPAPRRRLHLLPTPIRHPPARRWRSSPPTCAGSTRWPAPPDRASRMPKQRGIVAAYDQRLVETARALDVPDHPGRAARPRASTGRPSGCGSSTRSSRPGWAGRSQGWQGLAGPGRLTLQRRR